MPRYFFSLVDGKHSADDKYGKELDSLFEAHLHALRMFEKLIQFIPDSLSPTCHTRASELLLGVEIEKVCRRADGQCRARLQAAGASGQALFADPDILLLDEPTNHLDINTIRWLEGVLNARSSTIVVISHDRHFLNSVCTHMADLDYRTLRRLPRQLRRLHDRVDAGARASAVAEQQGQGSHCRLEEFVRRFRANKSKARQATSRAKAIEKIKIEDVKPSSRQNPYIRFEVDPKAKLHRIAVEIDRVGKAFRQPLFSDLLLLEAGKRLAIIGANGSGKTTLLRTLPRRARSGPRNGQMGGKGAIGYTRRTNRPYSKAMSRSSTG